MISSNARGFRRLVVPVCISSIVFAFWGCSKPPSYRPSYRSHDPGGLPAVADPSNEPNKKWFDQILLDDMSCSTDPNLGKPSLRLLTPDEYQNTVRDILQEATDYRGSLFKPAEVNGFSNNTDVGTISDSRLDLYLNVAQKISDSARARLPALVGCAESEKLVCANKVIDNLAPLLWRRPLLVQEKDELRAFYARSTVATESMTLLFMRILTSANFLYRSEIGNEQGLTDYELASALSYFFWGTAPDKRLRELAEKSKLSESANLESEANRLLTDKRSIFFMNTFSSSWLGYKKLPEVEKDQAKFSNYNERIAKLMLDEADKTFESLIRQSDSKFENMLTNDFSIGDRDLAAYYGAEASISNSAPAISFANEARRGIFSLGAVLTSLAPPNQTNPFRTGGFLMSRLLCDEPIPTPDGLVVTLPQPSPNATSRELAELHSASPGCKGCHVKIDGVGFAFETFDAVGVFRSSENGKKIDASGTLVGVDGKDSKFSGVNELSTLLGSSRQAKRCFTLQLYRYAHGRLERSQDVCPVRAIATSLEEENLSLSQLIVKVITQNAFIKRGN